MNLPSSAAAAGRIRPTKVRHKVVGLVMLMGVITYLDRSCIATVTPEIMRDLKLTKEQMSWVFSIFSLAYALFEVPTAWWADRQGTRKVLTRIVLWWSACTMLTGAAIGYGQLLATRFLFGAGEAGAWPSVARTFSRWIPLRERGKAQGIFFAAGHLAGGLTPMIVIALLTMMNWRLVFVIFGAVGLGWSLIWYRWFRNEPAEHPEVNAQEVAEIQRGRGEMAASPEGGKDWRHALGHPNLLPLCLAYVPNSAAFYFCITWLPTMLKEKYGFSAMSLGLASGLPLIFAVVGDLSGGFTTDALSRLFGLRLGRVSVGVAGNLVAGIAMLGAGWSHHPFVAVGLLATSIAATMFTLGATWSTCLDIGGAQVGVVSAAMNTSGQLGSILGPLAITALLAHFGSWNAPLFALGGSFLLGAICWIFINPLDRIF